jgi:hypothetical protein
MRGLLLALVVALIPNMAQGAVPSPVCDESTVVEPLCEVSNSTVEELAERMPEDIKHLAADVLRICRENEVNAEFIAAIMKWERRPDLHNYFGWMGADGKLKRFDSDLDCLEWVIPRIKRLYLTEGGRYYHGATVEGVSICYNNTEVWRETIKGEMKK